MKSHGKKQIFIFLQAFFRENPKHTSGQEVSYTLDGLQAKLFSSLSKLDAWGLELIVVLDEAQYLQLSMKQAKADFSEDLANSPNSASAFTEALSLFKLLGNEGIRFSLLDFSSLMKNLSLSKQVYIERAYHSEKSFVIASKSCYDRAGQLSSALGIQTISLSSVAQKEQDWQSKKSRNFASWPLLTGFILRNLRTAFVERKTKETEISLRLALDAHGESSIDTGLNFFNHMLENLAKHAKINLYLKVKGDLKVDEHHSIEDVGIVMGIALKQALGDKRGLARYGFVLPMDESSAKCLLDFSGRFSFVWEATLNREYVGDFPTEMLRHFYESFASSAMVNLHMKLRGENEHHLIESSFKALGKCMRQAILQLDDQLPSTKGLL